MRFNKMCPFCVIKKYFSRPSKVTEIYEQKVYDNGVCHTPPMGWSSWNTFKNNINEDVIYETAVAMKESGLLDAGYQYVNIDDCWHSSMRDQNGEMQPDLTTFASGIPNLVKKINDLGLKVGIYSSNGTYTCEDLPASLGNEKLDAQTFARWGIEYFKYDFCHNIPISRYAPLIYGITIAPFGSKEGTVYSCHEARLEGLARFRMHSKVPGKYYVSGLDANLGLMEYTKISVPKDGEYVLTVNIYKKGRYDKFLMVRVNDSDNYTINVPPQKFFNYTARFQVVVKLKEGNNNIKLFNPIHTRADSAMMQYINMGKILKEASYKIAKENNAPQKPIVYSICEWGYNKPWRWGKFAGNLWRTTPDIRPIWIWIKIIYSWNVRIYKYSQKGCHNDPDMLEVGNGKLTKWQNISHFSLWCMMNAPLILGNDIRVMSDEIKEIVTNKNLIAINQDPLCKACKRVVKGRVDVLAKPLSDGSVALCLFNKSSKEKNYDYNIKSLIVDDYVALKGANRYKMVDQWTEEESYIEGAILSKIAPNGVRVYKITPMSD